MDLLSILAVQQVQTPERLTGVVVVTPPPGAEACGSSGPPDGAPLEPVLL